MRIRCLMASIVIIMTVAVAGCWDRRELNDLAIAVGLGFDYKDNQIQVTAQFVNPGEVASKQAGGSGSPPVTTLSTSEATISEALEQLTSITPRKVFSSHLRIMVLGEELARQGLARILDGVSRQHEMRSDFYIIIAKGKSAGEVLEILTPLEKIPANKMYRNLEVSQKQWAPTVKIHLDRFMSDISNPTKDTVLTGVIIKGNKETGKTKANLDTSEPGASLQFSGVGIIKEDKLVDWMNEEESKGYNYIMDNVKHTVGHLSCPKGGSVAVKVDRSNSRIKGKVIDGMPQITVHLFVEENVGEVQCSLDFTKPEAIQQLEKQARSKLTGILESAVRKAKNHKADIFGFGEAIEDADPKAWSKLKEDWDNRFAEMEVNLEVDVQIRRIGTINNWVMDREVKSR